MLVRRRASLVRVLLGLAALLALALPASAAALPGDPIQVEIVNQSGEPDSRVWVTPTSPGTQEFDVEGFTRESGEVKPKNLEQIGGKLQVNGIESGRIYITYGAGGVQESEPVEHPVRFDWIELTTGPGGVANLTAVDAFSIGMRLEALRANSSTIETLGEANANTIFNAMQQIPGGPQATVRGPLGEPLRILSPQHSSYPYLDEYLRSMAGKSIVLHSTFNRKIPPQNIESEHAASRYVGTFAADGTVTLTGKSQRAVEGEGPLETTPEQIVIPAAELLKDIYTDEGIAHNDLEGALRRDLYVGFTTGLWGGRYGDDSAAFCTNPGTNSLGTFCPQFDVPAFGDARATPAPYATCEQYAAVINQYSDSYGNPFSDDQKKTTVALDGETKKLRLTILPDSGGAMPVKSGNPNCGAASAGPPAPAPKPSVPPAAAKIAVHAKLLAQTKLGKHGMPVAQLNCSAACGKVRAVVRKGKKVVARALVKHAGAKAQVVAKPTKPGRKILAAGSGNLKLRVELWVTPAVGGTQHFNHALLLKR